MMMDWLRRRQPAAAALPQKSRADGLGDLKTAKLLDEIGGKVLGFRWRYIVAAELGVDLLLVDDWAEGYVPVPDEAFLLLRRCLTASSRGLEAVEAACREAGEDIRRFGHRSGAHATGMQAAE